MARLSSEQGVTASKIPCTEEGVLCKIDMELHVVVSDNIQNSHLFYFFIALEVSVVLVAKSIDVIVHLMACMFNM